MSEQESGLSRRNFIRMVGAAGGTAAVHETLVALGLMRHPTAWAGPPKCEPGVGNGQTVVVLGAGIGGLATAFWLEKCGYRCTILEAQGRVGGRSHTARRGDQVFEEGREPQTCNFDEDERLYVNLGPGRIPYHHRRLLTLCEDLDVPLEVYVHTSDHNLHYMKDACPPMNRAVERRRIAYDTQGYIAELLAKAVNQNALDKELSEGDRGKLLDLLKRFGDLNRHHRYRGAIRSGCQVLPVDVRKYCSDNAHDAIRPLELEVLLDSQFWDADRIGAPTRAGFYQVKDYLWQTTSFQPVGGMDKIVKTIGDKIGDAKIKLNAVATRIAYAEGGKDKVEVTYKLNGTPQPPMVADFCVSNIPLTVLQGDDIDTPNFKKEVQDAVDNLEFSNACKVGWQANRRFWEKDHHIYGGISWIQHEIAQMWYPSNDYHWKRPDEDKGVGVLTGAYNYGKTAGEFGDLSFQKRLDLAYKGGALLHPGAFDGTDQNVPKDKGISIAWQNVRFQKGCSANWNSEDGQNEKDYERLLVPDMNQRFYFVGDQVSTLPGWQEGALMSAEHVVGQIVNRREGPEVEEQMLKQIREDVEHAPNSLEMIG